MASLKRPALAGLTVIAALGCGPTLPNDPMPGSYVLTSYTAAPAGGQPMDMIALGVRWTLDVGPDNSVVSTTWIAQDTIAKPTVRSGTIVRNGNVVHFSRVGTELLTGRQWTFDGSELYSVGQTVGTLTSTIRFTKQE